MAKLLSAKELEQIELGFRYVMNMTKNVSNPAKKRAVGRRGKNRIQQEEMQQILQQVACLINLLHDYNNRIK
jgi:hypothetical protein